MNRNLDRILFIIVIILGIFVSFDIYRRVRYFFGNNSIEVRDVGNQSDIITQNRNNANNMSAQVYGDIDFYDTNSEDEAIYHNYLNGILKSNWENPVNYENIKAEFKAIINRDGKITSYEMAKSSGNSLYDQRALETIMNTSPFQPFYGQMQGNERVFTFYFNGSRAGANGYSFRHNPLPPLANSIDQSNMKTKTPKVQDVKASRVRYNRGYFPCAVEIGDKWRPNILKNSNVVVDFRLNSDGSITNIRYDEKQDSEAIKSAIETLKSVKCSPLTDDDYIDIRYSFIVEDYVYSNLHSH